MRFLSLTLFVLFLSFFSSIAQQTMDYLTIDNGLSQNYIFTIYQDKKGFLWIGTKDGLNRFDGYGFRYYRFNPFDSTSLSGNNVSVVFEDSKERLWIGTNGGGLNLFNRFTETFKHFKTGQNETSLSSNFISSLYESSDGFIWAGTNDGGLNRLDPSTDSVKQFTFNRGDPFSISSNFISGISESKDGLLWIATAQGGLNRYDKKSNTFFHILPNDQKGLELKYENDATSLLVDKDGMIWFGSASGLNLYNSQTGKLQRFPINDLEGRPCLINNIMERENKLYITSFQIFAVFDKADKKYTILYDPAEKWFTNAVCKDKSGIFWLGTGGWGVMKYNPNTKMFNSKAGVFLKEVYPVAVDVLQKKYSLFKQLLEGRGTEFLPIHKTIKGDFLIATPRMGLIIINETGKSSQKIDTNPYDVPSYPVWAVSDVFEDKEGIIWIATVGGLSRYDDKKNIFIYYRLYDDKKKSADYLNKSGAAGYSDISAVFVDSDNIFWLGTPDRGLIRFDYKKQLITNYHQNTVDKKSISSDHILSIFEDEQNPGYLWIGTEGGGLNHFQKATGTCLHITTEDGLPNNIVYGILPDEAGNLWISTNNGISCFNPVTKSFKNYDVESGLQSNEFNRKEYYRSPDGKLYFGGILGYNAFYPKDIQTNRNRPQIVITDFKLFNKHVSYKDELSPLKQAIESTKEIILQYSQNVITFEYAALEYTTPNHNTYQYILEGFNSDWVQAGIKREATFTNLDPGEYKFRVKGANSDGVWGTDEAFINLIILPPYYMTWWFKTVVVLLVLLIVGSIIRYVIYRRVRERIIKSEHEAAMERERLRIARDLHDEIGSRLTELRMISEMVAEKDLDDSEVKQKLIELSNASENVSSTFGEIVWSLNPKNDLLEELIGFLSQQSTDFLSKADIRCRLDLPDKLPNYMVTSEIRHNIIFTVKELMNNVVKHSGASIVQLNLTINEIELVFEVKDDGVGFNVNNTRKYGNGLQNIKSRIESIGCTIAIDSMIDNGTSIKIIIPTYLLKSL
ncbi:MAG: two-component regulator propeller domain-containing protein [Ignavibacteria bacterium]|nr:two-component regulator propeller domain-containing protein [Ignavibacteria bacterium]